MKKLHLYLLPLLLIFFATSCANYKINYSKESENWAQASPPTDKKLTHRMYLVGDAGNAPMGGTTSVLSYLNSQLPKESKNSSLVFLGDNIYPGGMPPKGEEEDRLLSEYRLKVQMDVLENFKGRSFFIPGNHDWRRWGVKGLKRQEKFIEKYMNRKIEDKDDWENYFLPDNGCAGPDVIELNENLVLVIVDSQWWLTDWDKEPSINDGCEVKNKFMFQFNFEEALRKHRRKNVVVAIHHPLYTNGPHGGASTFKEHIFPLTQLSDNLYIPIPIIGSIGAFFRGVLGSKQDVAHQTYKELIHAVLAGASKNGSFIFASGHEHNLQYIEKENQSFIVSGSGSKTSPARIGSDTYFTAGKKGFSTIDFYEGGESWVSFWIPNEDGSSAALSYRKKLREKQLPSEDNIPTSFPIFEQGLDSIETVVSQINAGEIGFVHKALFGEHHRKIYQQTYKFPVLDLSKFRGGMTPIKRGGGNQTNSLRMKDPDGRQFVMRAMTKDASRLLPFPFNKMTAAQFLAEDNFLSTHPFAPLAIPTLAEAAGIYHTSPKFYYIPKQPALGIYNDEYGGDVYLVEERPAGNWNGTGTFGDSEKIIGTPDVTDKIVDNHKHYIDGGFSLRNRLFDIIIGDWDRHDDQWRWARFDKKDMEEGGEERYGKHRLYRPIPRDRDQAFSKYDGTFVGFARLFMPFLRQLRVYGPEISNMKWITWSSRNFDRSFLNEMAWDDWEKEIEYLQTHLTDEAIDEAFEVWPEVVQDLSADHIKNAIKARRDNLKKYARRFYQRLSKRADVYGTDKKEIFEIDRFEDGKVNVKVWEYSKKKGVGLPIFDRTYTDDVTKEIHIYGIGDDDQFIVKGNVDRSILVRLIGGQGKDEFVDQSSVTNGSKKTYIYDNLKKNKVALGPETKDKRSDFRELNIYDRRAAHYEPNFFVPLPILGANPDDGFGIGMSAIWTTYAFKKEPYASLQSFALNYAFATKALRFEYSGDFPNVFGRGDFYLEGRIHNDAFAANFFGLGNGTINDDEQFDIDYYRTRQSQFHIFPAYKKRFAGGAGNFKIGPVFEMRELQATEGRFLITQFRTDQDDEIYDRKIFGGAQLNIEFLNLDNFIFPHKGIHFNTSLFYLGGLRNDDTNFTGLRSSFAFYQSLDTKENIVLASQIGLGHNFGDNFEFYHAPNLGGRESLRGYRFERFYGQTTFWQNIDIRFKLFSNYNKTLPFTLGLFAGFDHGRVWYDGDGDAVNNEERADNWHYNYGGGFWIAPVDVLTFTFGLFQPREDFEEGPRFAFRLGMGF